MAQQHSSSGHRSDSPQLAAALSYAARGWRVFPLHSPTRSGGCTCGNADCTQTGKHPRTHHGLKDASSAEGVLRIWWGQQWRRANVAIATGNRSGLVVLDVDPRHEGLRSLTQIQEQFGALPETLKVATGGGGEHWYFQHPGGDILMRTGARVAGLEGLDVRGDGGYVVAPPSWHASGARYDWVDPSIPVASLPDWLLELLMKLPEPPPEARPALHAVGGLADGQRWLTMALERAVEGTRNETGFWLACQLRDDQMSQETAESLMADYAARVPGSGYSLREAMQSLRQAYGAPARDRARDMTRPTMTTRASDYATRGAHALSGPATTWRRDDDTTGNERDERSEQSAEQEARRQARFTFLSDEEVEMLPPPSWQLSTILVQNSLSVVYGEFGSAKSFLVLDWALSIATGKPWMGKTVTQGMVAYIAGEGIGGMGKRIRAWKQQHDWTGGPTGLWVLGSAPLLLHMEDVVALRDALRALPEIPALVVIDTLARSMTGGDENSAQDMGLAVAAAESIRAEFGCHVLLVHHKPAGAQKTRGSTALPGAADTLIDVTKDGEHLIITCEKQKEAAPFERVHCKLLTVVVDEAALDTSCVLVPTVERSNARLKLAKSAENVLHLLREQPEQQARFADLQRGMEEQFGMSKQSLVNALGSLRDAGAVGRVNGLWKIVNDELVK